VIAGPAAEALTILTMVTMVTMVTMDDDAVEPRNAVA
jgi:hypothetical protein